jgi:hypothetical protein
MDKATKLARALEIRANVLRVLPGLGEWRGEGKNRHLGAKIGSISVSYRTPFQALPKVPEQLRYMQALLGGKDNLPYGLDVWTPEKKVLNLEWDDAGTVEIVSFKPGEWEGALAIAASSA